MATTTVQALLSGEKVTISDTFTRTETNGWGTSDSGQAWTVEGTAASSFGVDGSEGWHDDATAGETQRSLMAGPANGEALWTVSIPELSTGVAAQSGWICREDGANTNFYIFRILFLEAGTLDARISIRVGGTETTLLNPAGTQGTYVANTQVHCRCRWQGSQLSMKLWTDSADEPEDWQGEVEDDTILVAGRVGVRSDIPTGWAGTDPLRFQYYQVEVTDLDYAETVDITSEVLWSGGIQGRIGRQTDLDAPGPSELRSGSRNVASFTLRNTDGRFTPGNLSSPYSPHWKTGARIRWAETIGARSFAYPDMYLEVPEATVTFQPAAAPTINDAVVHVTCYDLLTRLDRAPRFISNLGAHILASTGTADLVAYWPLNDATGSRVASPAVGGTPLRPLGSGDQWFPPNAGEMVVFGSLPGPPGEDGLFVEFNIVPGTSPIAIPVRLSQLDVNVIETTGTGNLSVTFWSFIPSATPATGPGVTIAHPVTAHSITLFANTTSTAWQLNVQSDPGSVAYLGPGVAYGEWQLVTAQLDCATGAVAMWVDAAPEATDTVGNATSATLSRVRVEGPADGSVAHLQVRIGTAFTRTEHLAQYRLGIDGLANQTVDARIRTIANLAGIPDSQLELEESDSVMPAPAFTGQRPGVLASAAAATGGGILFTRDSELVYHDRKHRFNL